MCVGVSGTKIIMSDLLYASYTNEEMDRKRRILEDEFHGLSLLFYYNSTFKRCWFTASLKESRHAWSLFGTIIS